MEWLLAAREVRGILPFTGSRLPFIAFYSEQLAFYCLLLEAGCLLLPFTRSNLPFIAFYWKQVAFYCLLLGATCLLLPFTGSRLPFTAFYSKQLAFYRLYWRQVAFYCLLLGEYSYKPPTNSPLTTSTSPDPPTEI